MSKRILFVDIKNAMIDFKSGPNKLIRWIEEQHIAVKGRNECPATQ